MTFPHHDSAAFLEVVQLGDYWFVRQTCQCHRGHEISVPFPTRARAESCRRALDEVNAQLLEHPLTAPSKHRMGLVPSWCVRGDLRQRRYALGLNAGEMAERLNVTKISITRAEGQGRSPNMVRRLEAALSDAERLASLPQHSA